MANWCRNSRGSYPNYWCAVTNEYVSWGIVEEKCKNNGYKCSYYHVSTSIMCNILGKNLNDNSLDGIKSLRDDYLEKDEKYSGLLKMYDSIGPLIAYSIENDPNRQEKAKEYYDKILLPISKLALNKKYDIALDHYSYFTKLLINEYGLNDLYNTLEETIEKYDFNIAKKMKKTLDL